MWSNVPLWDPSCFPTPACCASHTPPRRFACPVPGHCQAGMMVKFTVT